MADGKEIKAENSNDNVEAVYEVLEAAAEPGGPQALTATTKLKPAGGFDRLVAPARYAFGKDSSKNGSTYVFERRFLLGEDDEGNQAVTTVLLDSRESNANRLEDAVRMAIESGKGVFTKMPAIEVVYGEGGNVENFHDYDLPHRAFDAHIRYAEFDPEDLKAYKKARRATLRNAGALFDISPITVLLGGWDSTGGCAKFPSLIVGETYGVLADQSCIPENALDAVRKRHGARLDPVSPSFEPLALSPEDLKGSAEEGNAKIIASKEKKGKRASDLNLGHIPPATDSVDGIAVSAIVRHNVLQFGMLRRLHFESRDDTAIRTLLVAMAIDAMVRASGELFLRANAQLVLAEPALNWIIDNADGNEASCPPLSIEEADGLLEKAYRAALEVGAVDWEEGNILKVAGNDKIYTSKKVEEESDAKETKES